MQIIRTILWVLLLIGLLLFSLNNWQPVELKIWEGLVLETRLPALVVVSFLLGLVPMWLVHRGSRWRSTRRVAALENAARANAVAAAPPAEPVVTEPVMVADPAPADERPPEAPPALP